MSNILFVAAVPLRWASARLRFYWPAEHIPDATVVTFDDLPGMDTSPYDVIVLQKQGRPELQKEWRSAGKLVGWDACDPMWWFSPDAVQDVVAEVDFVTVSTSALASDFNAWSGMRVPSHVLPDTIKLEHYPMRREHVDASPVRLIWYGVAVNRIALAAAWANLARLVANGFEIELTLFDNAPGLPLGFGDDIPVYSIPWTLERENAVIAAHDIALLPPYPGPWGRMKSNNKCLTALACGLPVTDGQDYGELVRLVESAERRKEAAIRGRKDLFLYEPWRAAKDWLRLFEDYGHV